MINSNSYPVIKVELPAMAGTIYLVPVESDQLTPIIVPVLSALPEMNEGTLNVENAVPIVVEEGVSPPRETGENEKPEIPSDHLATDVPLFISKAVSKERVESVAKHIAKDVIPEKIIQPLHLSNSNLSTKPPSEPSKDDKAAVDQARKDPENSNLSVPKEAVKRVADQPTYKRFDAPSEGSAKMQLKNHTETTQVYKPDIEKKDLSYIRFIHQESQEIKGRPEESKASHKYPESNEINRQEKPFQGLKEEKRFESLDKGYQPKEHENSLLPAVNKTATPNQEKPSSEPSKKGSENHIGQRKNLKEVEVDNVIKPRKDAIPVTEKHDHNTPVVCPQRPADDSQVAKVPFLLDFPLSRDSIYRQANTQKHVRARQDQGFRLDDMLLMIFAAVLCGAKNTLEVCRYLQTKEKFFKAWMGIKHSMPSYRLIWFLLNKLSPRFLISALRKVLMKDDSRSMQLLHVWEAPRGIVLGDVASSSSQAKLIDALQHFDLEGVIVNIEQEELNQIAARKVRASGGEFILALNGNLKDLAQEAFKSHSSQHRDVFKEGAATILRETWVSDDLTWFSQNNDWPELKTTVKFNSESIQGERLLYETRIYLSSLALNADKMSQALRIFTLIEAQVNWLIDLDFFTLETGNFREHEKENIESMETVCQEIIAKLPGSSLAHRKQAGEDSGFLRELLNSLHT